MKTIAELKAEDNINKMFKLLEDSNKRLNALSIECFKQSLSQVIDKSVAGCRNRIIVLVKRKDSIYRKAENRLCQNVPPEQKCEGCKRLLKFKEEL